MSKSANLRTRLLIHYQIACILKRSLIASFESHLNILGCRTSYKLELSRPVGRMKGATASCDSAIVWTLSFICERPRTPRMCLKAENGAGFTYPACLFQQMFPQHSVMHKRTLSEQAITTEIRATVPKRAFSILVSPMLCITLTCSLFSLAREDIATYLCQWIAYAGPD